MSNPKAIETHYKGYLAHSNSLPQPAMKQMSVRANRMGQRFGRLLVVECLGIAPVGYRWWGCICDCGTKIMVRSRELDRGHTRSYGCLQRENRAKYPGVNKLPYGYASRNELLASYRRSAENRGISWALEDDDFFAIISANCVYCGAPPNTIRKPNKGVNGEYVYSGVDRIDNTQGYTTHNAIPCCWDCNRAKGTLPVSDFLQWADRLVAYTAARSARFEHGRNVADDPANQGGVDIDVPMTKGKFAFRFDDVDV